jgi:hypothetical protein
MRLIIYLCLIELVLSGLAGGPAFAQSRADRETRARELFAAGSYHEALDIYTKLYAETTHPTYIRNIGRCYQNLGDSDRAIASFREYLRQAKDLTPEQRAQVEAYIVEMKELKRSSGETSASRPAPQGASGSAGPLPAKTTATKSAANEATTPPGLDGPRASVGGAEISDKRASESTAHSRVPAYVVGAASLLAIGTGAVFGVRAISERHDSDTHCPMDLCTSEGISLNDQAKSSARIADVTIGFGVIGVGVAAYLFIASHAGDTKGNASAAAALHLLPEVGPAQAGLALGGSW